MAQEWKKPLETSLKLSPPYTAVGLEREVWEESPSLPSRLSPQQYPVPALVMPQDRKYPALRVSNCRLVRTGAGNLCGVVLESPSSPTALVPQQGVTAAPLIHLEVVKCRRAVHSVQGRRSREHSGAGVRTEADRDCRRRTTDPPVHTVADFHSDGGSDSAIRQGLRGLTHEGQVMRRWRGQCRAAVAETEGEQ